MKPYPLTDKDSLDLLMMESVKAGFPSPAEEVREKLDLTKLLVRGLPDALQREEHEVQTDTRRPGNDFLIWDIVTWVIKKV